MAVNFGDNFNIGAFKPIDQRMVVDLVSNLTDGTVTYPYKGMMVSVKNDNGFVRTYRLKTEPLNNNPIPLSAWEIIGQSSSLASLPDVYINNAKTGDVLTYGTNATGSPAWINQGPIVSVASAGTNGTIIFKYSDGTQNIISVGGLENNDYSSNNFILDGQSYNNTISILDSILGAIVPAKPANLTGTNLTVSNTTLFNARISASLPANWSTLTPGQLISNYVIDNTYDLTSPSPSTEFNAGIFSQPSSYGTVSHVRNGSSFVSRNMSLGTGINSNTDANGVSSLNVTSIVAYNSLWAKANATISYTQNSEGTVTHAMSSTVAGSTNTLAINYDNSNPNPSFTSLPVVTTFTPVTKFLSGIQYYDIGTKFQLSFTAASGIFDRCYHPSAVALVTGNGFSNVSLNPGSVPNYTDNFVITNNLITLNQSNVSTGANNGSMTITLQKPAGNNLANVQQYPLADVISGRVNTYGIVSTATFEAFLDESNRVFLSTNTAFDSTISLPNGEAQVRNGSLTYGNVDYPSKTGDQRYDRKFTVGVQNGGSMTFVGINGSNVSAYNTGNINIFLQLETVGGYYDLGKPFGSNNGTGDGSSIANSKGGQVSVSGTTLNYTFGTFSTASNSNQFRMIIVFRNSTNSITSVNIN